METLSSTISSKSRTLIMTPKHVMRLTCDDLEDLHKLTNNEEAQRLFGNFKLDEIVYKSFMTVGIIDNDENIAGMMSLSDYPNIPAIPPLAWPEWLHEMYSLPEARSSNTLWIHLMLWDPPYYYFFLKPMVQYLFQVTASLEYIILVVPPVRCRTDYFVKLGATVKPKGIENSSKTQNLFVMSRADYITDYKIRGAVEEDNDDILPLIQKLSPQLIETYGDYYLSEIISTYNKSYRKVIVAQEPNNSTAVGVFCVNEIVNYASLNEEFNLTPLSGLKKDYKTSDEEVCYVQYHKDPDESHDLKKSSLDISLNFENEVVSRASISDSEQFSLIFTSASLFCFQDDEEEEVVVDDISTLFANKPPEVSLLSWVEHFEAPKLERESLTTVSTTDIKTDYIPTYIGEPNAFALEIAAVSSEHELCIKKLFKTIFEIFPDREYCVLTLPSAEQVNEINKYFSRVTPRFSSTCPHELYVMHKSSILGDLEVVPLQECHMYEVQRLLSTTCTGFEYIEAACEEYWNGNTVYECFALCVDDNLIGLAVIVEELETSYLQSHYDLYPVNFCFHRSGSHGLVESLILSPGFHNQANFFLREIHRLSQYDVLYYKLKPIDRDTTNKPVNNLLECFVPVLPLSQPSYDTKMLKAEGYINKLPEEQEEIFSLYISSPITCSSEHIHVNTKIVIVGCTNTSISFLISLLYGKSTNYLITFNNITLVCKEYLNFTQTFHRMREAFIIKKNFIDAKYLDLVNLRTYINIISGDVTEINRREKIIIIDNSKYLPYELLFLMSGEKFHIPPRVLDRPITERPENVFVINNVADASKSLQKLKSLYSKYANPTFTIIVYGHFLQAYCTINGLLVHGVPGTRIILVEPFPYSMAIEKKHRHNVSMFNEPEVDHAILDSIRREGIQIYSSYYFIDWDYDTDLGIITAAQFESRHKMLQLDCLAMFFFSDKEISPKIYKVLNNAGLVYDGRLVINSEFQTNDPNIYSAGTLTKYSRKYFAPFRTHKYFNRTEIGEKLGYQIREKMLPLHLRQTEKEFGWMFHLDRGSRLVPLFEKPIMKYCRLPGGLYYFSLTKPGQRIPLETTISMDNFGSIYITGNIRNLRHQGFFRLHFNEENRVETITCLTKFPLEIYNLHCLWGKHESLLDNLFMKFEMLQIRDLFKYFNEPWTYALYHNKFNDLLDNLNMLMTSVVYNEEDSIVHSVISKYKENKWKRLKEEDVEELCNKFKATSYPKILEQKVLKFIKSNLNTLPVYAHPIVIKNLLMGFDDSSLFFNM